MNQRRAWSVALFCRHTGADGVARVLLIQHVRLQTWLPVGGELEAGESPVDAAIRELREETGYVIGKDARFVDVETAVPGAGVDGAPTGLLAYEEHPAGSKGIHQNFCFLVDVDHEDVVGCDEFSGHRFLDREALLALPCPLNVRQLGLRALAGGRVDAAAVARLWLAAFNARDLDGLVALYATDAVHVSPKLREQKPETGGEIAGHAALRAWWGDAFTRLTTLQYRPVRVVAEGRSVFLEYVRVLEGASDLIVAERYDLNDDGRICRSHVFHG